MVLSFYAAIVWFPLPFGEQPPLITRVAFALECSLLVVFWVIFSVARIGNQRFSSPEDIDGAGLTSGTEKAKMLVAILQNTLEQAFLACLVYLIWAVVMPSGWIACILAAALLFCLGRVLFILGYQGGAPSRALGFALTFYPTVMMFVWVSAYILKDILY